MKIIFQIKRILRAGLVGLLNKPLPRFVPKESKLSQDCFEDKKIVYKTRFMHLSNTNTKSYN